LVEDLDLAIEAFTRAVAHEFYAGNYSMGDLAMAADLRVALDDPAYAFERLITQNALYPELRRNVYPLAFPAEPARPPDAPPNLEELVMEEERLLHCLELMELYGNPATRDRVPQPVRGYRFIENLFDSYTQQMNQAQLVTAAGLVSRQRLAEMTRIAALARAARIVLHASDRDPPRIPSLRPNAEEREVKQASGAPAAAAAAAPSPQRGTPQKQKKKKPDNNNKVGGPFLVSAPPPLLPPDSPREAWMQQAISGIATLARGYGLV
jgi:hypothetical protein